MEPITMTVTTISSLIFLKALEKGSQQLGKTAYQKIRQLLSLIHEKFKSKGMEEILAQTQDSPIEMNKSVFQIILETQMEEDETFAQKLKALMDELKSDEQIDQIFFQEVNGKGNAEIGEIEQIAI